MQIRIIKVGSLQTNCYILIKDGNCIIIDPGDQFFSIEHQIGDNKLVALLVTHRHPDHIGALDKFQREYSVPVYEMSNLEEKKYDINGFRFEVIYTKGHTNDSVSFYFYEYNFIFSGDFLFKGSIGRTDLPTGSNEEMKESINKIINYSDRIRVYPGHGDMTNLGEEKETNPFFN